VEPSQFLSLKNLSGVEEKIYGPTVTGVWRGLRTLGQFVGDDPIRQRRLYERALILFREGLGEVNLRTAWMYGVLGDSYKISAITNWPAELRKGGGHREELGGMKDPMVASFNSDLRRDGT